MKKKYIIILIIIGVLLGSLLIYKISVLKKYRSEAYYWSHFEYFKNSITIKTKKEKNLTNYDGLLLKNYFKGFDTNNVYETNIKYDKNGNPIAVYYIEIYDLFIDILNLNTFMSENPDIDKSTPDYVKDYLDKYNIKNDFDLIKHVDSNYFFSSNIFTSNKKVKINKIMNSFVETTLLNTKDIVEINGDLTGYILYFRDDPGIRQIHLIHNNKQYIIILNGDEVTSDEFITKLLQSVQFAETEE